MIPMKHIFISLFFFISFGCIEAMTLVGPDAHDIEECDDVILEIDRCFDIDESYGKSLDDAMRDCRKKWNSKQECLVDCRDADDCEQLEKCLENC